jgi:4'-phosphopantetheinyl transferase
MPVQAGACALLPAESSAAPRHARTVEIAIVTADLDREGADRRTLSPDELERAGRFRFARDRRRFVAGRTILRRELSRRLDCTPGEITFAYGPYGKPAVDGIAFNVSHSGGTALFAFTADAELGVDVELHAHARADDDTVAERFFSPTEVASLREHPRGEQSAAFLRCWTRKEAFVKARGDGLSLPLHDFDVDFALGRGPALLRTAWSADEPREWTIKDLSHLFDGAVAALAVRAHRVRIDVTDNVQARKEQQ